MPSPPVEHDVSGYDVIVSGSTATFTLLGIAGGGDTDVRATDASGATGTLHLTSGLCGRPDDLWMVRLVSPAAGSTGVSTAVGSVRSPSTRRRSTGRLRFRSST